MALVSSIFVKVEVLERSDLVLLVFKILDDSWRAIFNEVLHSMKSLVDSAPVFGFAVDFLPQVLHNHGVVGPRI